MCQSGGRSIQAGIAAPLLVSLRVPPQGSLSLEAEVARVAPALTRQQLSFARLQGGSVSVAAASPSVAMQTSPAMVSASTWQGSPQRGGCFSAVVASPRATVQSGPAPARLFRQPSPRSFRLEPVVADASRGVFEKPVHVQVPAAARQPAPYSHQSGSVCIASATPAAVSVTGLVAGSVAVTASPSGYASPLNGGASGSASPRQPPPWFQQSSTCSASPIAMSPRATNATSTIATVVASEPVATTRRLQSGVVASAGRADESRHQSLGAGRQNSWQQLHFPLVPPATSPLRSISPGRAGVGATPMVRQGTGIVSPIVVHASLQSSASSPSVAKPSEPVQKLGLRAATAVHSSRSGSTFQSSTRHAEDACRGSNAYNPFLQPVDGAQLTENPFEAMEKGPASESLRTPKAKRRPPWVETHVGSKEACSVQAVATDLIGNPFDYICGTADYLTLAVAPCSQHVLEALHRESAKNLDRLVWNVNTGLGADALHQRRLQEMTAKACTIGESSPQVPVARALSISLGSHTGCGPVGTTVAAQMLSSPPFAAEHLVQPPPWCGPMCRAPDQQPNILAVVAAAAPDATPALSSRWSEFEASSAGRQEAAVSPEETPLWGAVDRIVEDTRVRPSSSFDRDLKINTPAPLVVPKLRVGSHTEAGQKQGRPDWANQDACLVVPLGPSRLLVGIFDGHGEHGGTIAKGVRDLVAQLAPKLFAEDLEPAGDALPDVLRRLFNVAHHGVAEGGFADFSGTTATLAIVDAVTGVVTCAHVGDSRLVIAADSMHIRFESPNHELLGEELRRVLVASGEVRERMVSGVVARRVFIPGQELPGLAMSRSLGDVQAHNLGVSADPSIHEGIPMASGSILIVGSGGIWDKVPALEAVALVVAEVAGGSVEFAAAALVSEARARWLLDGGGLGDVDDASAVVVFLSR